MFLLAPFCETYCISVLLSAGCRTIVPLASGIFPLVCDVGPEAFATIPLKGGLIGLVVTRACAR